MTPYQPLLDDITRVSDELIKTTKTLEQKLMVSVATARVNRASWKDIGNALGITRQGAWERFHYKVHLYLKDHNAS